MKIFVQDARSGNQIELHVSEDLTFREVKKKYYSALGDFTSVKFLCNGEVLKDEKRLCDYDVEDDDIITAAPLLAQGGGGHICPYGCGREIPDNYKGCTELLKDHPNYFK